MKRLFAIFLMTAILCAMLPQTVFAAAFPDIPEDAWYDEYVTFAVKQGWVNGFPDGSFRPSASLTRGMFVTLLYRQAGSPRTEGLAQPFKDVKSGAYYAAAVRWANAQGVTKGVDAAHFAPDGAVTREQAATMLYRYAQCMGVLTEPVRRPVLPFTDGDDCADYAREALLWMKQSGVIEGYEDGSFRPKQAVVRSECAKLLCGIYDRLPAADPAAVRELTAGIPRSEPDDTLPDDAETRAAVLDFCAALTRESLTTEKNEVISPVSALYALGMTANGAQGETLAQLESAFGVPVDRLNEYLRGCGQRLCFDAERNKSNLANSIWINAANDFTCAPEYLQTLVKFYNAQAFYGTFDQQLCDALNEWVSENTYGMIPRMLDRVEPTSALYLVNTLALRLHWNDIYTKTLPGVFTAANGQQQACQMIPGTEHRYLHDENTVGFVKSYERRFVFAALLPDEGVSMEDYLASLTGEKLRGLLGSMETDCRVITKTPEFGADSSFRLEEPLRALGVTDLFEYGMADLSGMGSSELFVSEVLQKAHLKLDKDGTEAAAATLILVEGSAAPPEKVYEVTLDRPFVYLIMDDLTKLPLFIGVTTTME